LAIVHHTYNKQAVVVVPHNSIGDFLRQSQGYSGGPPETVPEKQINWLAQLCSQSDAQDYLIAAMVDLVEPAVPHIESRGSRSIDKSVMSNVLKAALQHEKYVLVETILAKLSRVLPPDWYSWLREWLIRNDGVENTLERFEKVKRGYDITSWCVPG
jgi:hypothetical protein